MAKIMTDRPEEINDNELVTLVQDKVDQGKNDGLERQWYINIAYMMGKQWLAWDGANKKLYEPPKGPGEERVISNQILPIVRTELAKITKSKPVFETIPSTSEEEDIQTAKACTKLIEYLWEEVDMDEKRFELALWFLVTGTAFLKVPWNPNKGEKITPSPDEIQLEEGQEQEDLFLGNIETDVTSPFDLKFDQSAKTWEDVRWCCEEKLRTVEYVEETYGEKVSPDDGLISTNIFEGMLANLNGYGNDLQQKKVKDGVVVREYWEIPSKKYPKGRHITIAGTKLLQYEDNPYGKLPYIPFIHIRVPGRVHGASMIEFMIPLQREYNQIRSKRLIMRKFTANPRILTPQGALINEPTNQDGEIIEYDPSRGIPIWQEPPHEPAHVEQELERIIRDMENISSIHEVSKGAAPPGVKSGVAISFLQEQDDTTLGPTIHSMENGFKKWAIHSLGLAEKFYIEPRLIKILGKNNEIEVMEFKGSDIQGNRDVRVVAGSMMPQNKAARQEFILNLVDRGIITDQQLILKLLEFGSIEEVFEEITLDINQAKAEQKKWVQGDLNTITRDFFNHEVHIQEHNKFRKSDDYEQLPQELQIQIDMHVLQHQEMLPPPIPMGMPGEPNPMTGGMPNEGPMGQS